MVYSYSYRRIEVFNFSRKLFELLGLFEKKRAGQIIAIIQQENNKILLNIEY
jgi:hypothetical protein